MNAHDTGRLRAFLDGELSADERRAVEAHLDQCAACASDLLLLRARAEGARARLDGLAATDIAPEPQAALARFKKTEAQVAPKAGPPAWWENVTRSFEMIKQNAVSPRWRPAFVALGAVLVVALLLSITPVRSFAADFLSLFRVQKFAVVPLDPGQMDKLEQFAKQAESQLGKPQIVREEGPAQTVADAAQASSLAGYAVRTPTRLPSTLALTKSSVRSGPAMHYEVDRATLEAFLQAAGISTEGLPQTDKLSFDVDVANFTAQQYGSGTNRLEFVQVPAPKVDLPDGLNPAALAQTAFVFLGMPADDAKRMADSIDWTSTLVIPLPAKAAQAREVTVDGVTGLLVEGTGNRSEKAVIWEKDGMLYSMSGTLDRTLLLDAADSLQ